MMPESAARIPAIHISLQGCGNRAEVIQTKFGRSTFIVFRRWRERPNERVIITVGIGWVLLVSATSWFSGYIKLAYCSSAKGLQ